MNNLEVKETLKKLTCIIAISMAVTGILFIPQFMFSRVKLSKTQDNESIDIAKSEVVSTEKNSSLSKVSSRSGEETRKSVNISETDTEQKENKEETKKETVRENKEETKTVEVKKESKKTETKTESKESKTKKEVKKETKTEETKKKTESSKKSNTEKNNSKKKETKTETKKETEKDSKKKENSDSQKTVKTEQTKNSSEKDTKKTTEKKDSSNNKTTTKKENKNSTTKTVSISQVKISRNMDLTKRTGLSRKDFIKLMSGVKADTSGFFEKNAGKIYDLCAKYSINEIFFCGLISAESGWNIASNHRRTHNYISLMRNGKLISYGSVNEGLEVAAQKLHYNYLTPGGKFYHGKTLSGVKVCFCPSSSWVGLVYGRMKQIV